MSRLNNWMLIIGKNSNDEMTIASRENVQIVYT